MSKTNWKSDELCYVSSKRWPGVVLEDAKDGMVRVKYEVEATGWDNKTIKTPVTRTVPTKLLDGRVVVA